MNTRQLSTGFALGCRTVPSALAASARYRGRAAHRHRQTQSRARVQPSSAGLRHPPPSRAAAATQPSPPAPPQPFQSWLRIDLKLRQHEANNGSGNVPHVAVRIRSEMHLARSQQLVTHGAPHRHHRLHQRSAQRLRSQHGTDQHGARAVCGLRRWRARWLGTEAMQRRNEGHKVIGWAQWKLRIEVPHAHTQLPSVA